MLRLLGLQCELAKGIVHLATKLKLQPYKTTFIHSLLPAECEARISHCRWLQELVVNRLLEPELMFYFHEVWSTLSS
jgi:hypothetical protein